MMPFENSDHPLDRRSRELRRLVVEALEGGGRGHIGPSMSIIEIIRVLYDHFLRFQPKQPRWEDRDRFILSKGHGCLSLYAILADKGFFSKDELRRFCREEAMLGGHPELGKVPGVEASTGALGHGLSIGVGMALASRMKGKNFRVAVLTGDGELNEGSNWEAAACAAKHQLSNLTVFIDYNKLQCYGPSKDVLDLGSLAEKWRSFGFATIEVDGHDVEQLRAIVEKLPLETDQPTAVICHTVKGKGFPFAEHSPYWHYKFELSKDDLAAMYRCLE